MKTRRPRPPQADFDSPWKEALEHYFAAFLEFFFPEVHADIDWEREPEFLDKELQFAVRRAGRGRRAVDKLVRVWRKDGREAWVLVHVEVQSQTDEGFGERMFICNTLLFSRHRHCVVSLGVMGDAQVGWESGRFSYELWGCKAGIHFPTVKLLDYKDREEELSRSRNPFALLTMAHVATQVTRRKPESRLRWKLRIMRWLYTKGYREDEFTDLFRFVDLMMALPEELQDEFVAETERYEEEQKMPLLSHVERKAIQRGMQQGMQQGTMQEAREAVLDVLDERLPPVPQRLRDRIARIDDAALLRILRRRAATVPSLEEFQRELQDHPLH